jgi:alpha-beta hydrolase superfamily lysophospholipase
MQGITRSPKLRRRLIAAFALTALLAVLTVAWVVGSVLSAPVNQPVGSLPEDLQGRSVEFASESGATIRGWLVEGRHGAGAVVLMHGLRSTRASMVGRARFLSRAGYTTLLFDFQAHGESKGESITFGHLESMDARAAVKFLRAAAPGERVGVFGVSMGGAAALLSSPPLDADAFVLEMVYPTINEAITNRLTMRFGDWASALTPVLSWQLKPRLGVSPESMRPIDRARELAAPKLFIAGAQDRHTTLAESRQLFEAARAPKEFWPVEGAHHQDLHVLVGAEYERRVLDFFEKNLRSQQ